MQIRRFHIETIPETGHIVELEPSEAVHAVRVLRLKEGDPLVLMDGRGTVADATVCQLFPGRRPGVSCKVVCRCCVPPPVFMPVLYVALPRDRLMSGILRMATELGVWRIVPLLTAHGVSRPEKGNCKERWREDLVSAMKQSGNPYIPELLPPTEFEEALAGSPKRGIIGAVPDEIGMEPNSAFRNTVGEVAVWVGPEAGFTPAEQAGLTTRGLLPVTVGPCILRIETAVPSLLGWLYGVCTQ